MLGWDGRVLFAVWEDRVGVGVGIGIGIGIVGRQDIESRVMKRSIVRQAERQTHALVWEEEPTNRTVMKSEDAGRSFRPAESYANKATIPCILLLAFSFSLSTHPLPNVLATSDRFGQFV